MTGTPITIRNHDTGEEIILNDHTDRENIIALQSFPTFEADVRQQNISRNGSHGEYKLPYYYGGMSIVLNGVIAGDDEDAVWEIKQAFDRIMSMPKNGTPRTYKGTDKFPPMFNNTVRLSFTTPRGQDVFIDATPIKSVSYNRGLQQHTQMTFQVILRANMPYLVVDDAVANIEEGSLGLYRKGFKLTTKLPFKLGSEYKQHEMTITMSAPGFAVVVMNGSDSGVLINPRITNLTNGNYVKIAKPLVGSSRYYKIDGLYQTMTDENNQSVQQYSEGDFIYLDAGDNKIMYTADKLIPN